VIGGADRVTAVRLPPKLFEAVDHWARSGGISRSDAIRLYLSRLFGKRDRDVDNVVGSWRSQLPYAHLDELPAL
jgi:metal-responsive CopG/Arc/MetJ family transcriptional regulator